MGLGLYEVFTRCRFERSAVWELEIQDIHIHSGVEGAQTSRGNCRGSRPKTCSSDKTLISCICGRDPRTTHEVPSHIKAKNASLGLTLNEATASKVEREAQSQRQTRKPHETTWTIGHPRDDGHDGHHDKDDAEDDDPKP